MKIAEKIFFFVILFAGGFCSCKEKYPNDAVISLPEYKKGEALLGIKNDSAFYYFNKVANTAKDSLQIATSYNNMATIQSDAGDYFGSQESLLRSLKYLDERKQRDYFCLSSDYNELGISCVGLKNYGAAIGYYNLALKFSRDDNFKIALLNNKALCYQKKGEYGKALEIYMSIMEQSKTVPKRYSRIVTNIASTKWLQDSGYNAAPELLMALQIRKRENDSWGLNSSYTHLAEYYFSSRPDSALSFAKELYKIAQQLNSPDDEMEALRKLIVLGPGNEVKPYFIRYQYLNDSIQTARNNAKNQFALIRYDAEKNKADNLQLQKDNSEKKLQIIWQRIFLYGALFALLFGAAITIFWFKKRKQQLIWESENAIREQQIKTSQKVHDVVANGLYRIMSDIEYKNKLDKEELLDSIETLYEKSRDISYETPVVAGTAFDTYIAALLLSFSAPTTKILIAGNNSDVWNNVSMKTKNELEPILQELMVNMKKHSRAENVVIKFERQENLVNIQYMDDGVGLAPSVIYGNGLMNTENRIKAMGGRIIFDRSEAKGMRARLYFPINHP